MALPVLALLATKIGGAGVAGAGASAGASAGAGGGASSIPAISQLLNKGDKKKKKKKNRNAEVDETNEDFKDPFAAAPAKGQPIQVKQRMRKIFGS